MNEHNDTCPICQAEGSYCTLGPALRRIATAQAAERSDAAFSKLHSAGWSIGDVGGPGGWIVSGHRGEQTIDAHGETQSKAWAAAAEQAEAMPTVIVEPNGSKHRSPGV